MEVLKKLRAKVNMQAAIVALCLLGVCVGTQQIQTVAWNTGIIESARDSLGVLMAVIIFTNYKWSDFVRYKIPYIIWSAAGILAGIFLIPIAFERRMDFLKADTIVIALGILLVGYCVIHTFISFFIEKYRPKFYRPLLVIWIVMMLLMIFSRSDYIWPECYFVLFLCYYLTPQTPEQRRNVTMGLIDGMILGFVLIQAHSLLFRPYDKLRYQGNFCNPNNNSLFLCLCLAAILAKILLITKMDRKKIVRIFYFLLAGSCYSFICMTMGRSAYLTVFVVTIFFLIAYCKIKKKKIFIRMGLLLVALFVVMLPVTYLAVRYVPTIHPHVLFYYQEGYSEDWVHSWDARDSEKFITFRQMLEGIFGRMAVLQDAGTKQGNSTKQDDSAEQDGSVAVSGPEDSKPAPADSDITGADADEMQTDPERTPVLTVKEGQNPWLVRYTIYKWFVSHLSLRGMPYKDQGLQVTRVYWVQHAHNIYLDYGINFGYPVMILFTVFIWWGIGRLFRYGLKNDDMGKLGCLLIALIPPVFGMFEFAWGAGLLSTVAFYMTFKEIVTE